jgi:hypothetical protein
VAQAAYSRPQGRSALSGGHVPRVRCIFEGRSTAHCVPRGMGGGMRRIAGGIVVAVLLVVLGAETVTAQETADL